MSTFNADSDFPTGKTPQETTTRTPENPAVSETERNDEVSETERNNEDSWKKDTTEQKTWIGIGGLFKRGSAPQETKSSATVKNPAKAVEKEEGKKTEKTPAATTGSSTLKTRLASLFRRSGPRQAHLHTGGKCYYDKEKKRWVLEGVEDDEDDDDAFRPPPMASSTDGGNSQNESVSTHEASEDTLQSTPMQSVGLDPGANRSIHPAMNNNVVSSRRGRGRGRGRGPASRYVNSFGVSDSTTAAAAPPTNLFVSPSTSVNMSLFVPKAVS